MIVNILLALLTLGIGSWFWAAATARRNCRMVFSNNDDIARIVANIGPESLVSEVKGVEPLFDSFAESILLYVRTHIEGQEKTRNMLLLPSLVVLGSSFLLGPWVLAYHCVLFLVPSVSSLPGKLLTNSGSLVHIVFLHICRWDQVDPQGCERFCTKEKRYLTALHQAAKSLQGSTTAAT